MHESLGPGADCLAAAAVVYTNSFAADLTLMMVSAVCAFSCEMSQLIYFEPGFSYSSALNSRGLHSVL